MQITRAKMSKWQKSLESEEKARATTEKYIRDVLRFSEWLGTKHITKERILEYKELLLSEYSPSSVNSHIASLNSFFCFLREPELRVKTVKRQRKIFSSEDKELTRTEYERLLSVAKKRGNRRLFLLMQTICACGIRVSELRFVTVEAIRCGTAEIRCKGKLRCVILPDKLCCALREYARDKKIERGSIFISRNGKPLDRSNIWNDMKKLCEEAGVSRDKVFPHNLRHFFARTYYSIQKDIVRLADILGHASVNTTRIYTMESGTVHRRQLQSLNLLLC